MGYAEMYHALSEQQKHTIRRKYIAMFGSRITFYRKINGTVKMLRAEVIFFDEHLKPKNRTPT